ncbi:serine/threonine protein kinase KIN3, partial [Ascoidea rubescens DSM 1968]
EFEVLELIGKGSFGYVRKVKRKNDGKLFVRKEISYDRMDPKERSQLVAEIRILKTVSHPNIVQYIYHEHDSDTSMVYLYMEYCDNGDLSKVIKNAKTTGNHVPEDLVWSIFAQLVSALYRCHYGVDPPPIKDNIFKSTPSSSLSHPENINNDKVVIHRDIKPDNVFLLKNNIVKLGDFGLAKLLTCENDLASTYVGTPYYMSPEVLTNRPYTPLCDIWSLGCVMYELCASHPPFEAKSHIELYQKIKKGIFPSLPNNYSSKLKSTITACINIDPDQRPPACILIQETSIKIFRKELELKLKEKQLISIENNLKKLEEKLRENMKVEFEKIRINYQNEFEFVVKQSVDK